MVMNKTPVDVVFKNPSITNLKKRFSDSRTHANLRPDL